VSQPPIRNPQPEDWKRRWIEESSWTAKELAKLCCGWNPGDEAIADPALYNQVMETILRAVRVGDLHPIDLRVPASREEFFYRDAPLFRPTQVSAWAAKRFPEFPFQQSDLAPSRSRDAIERRRMLVKNAVHLKGLKSQVAFCRIHKEEGLTVDILRAVISGDSRRADIARWTAKVLALLGVTEEDWNHG
jgi:hypothetical protein